MVTRLPTPLDALIPSPSSFQEQTIPESTLLKPWRGLFLVSGTRTSDLSSNVEIRVTGVETDGDIKSYSWPPRLIFSITVPHALPVLPQLQEYVKNRVPPVALATFLPERLREPDRNVVNQTHFHSLSRLLWDSQLVAVVPISTSDSTSPASFSQTTARHGMLIYPAANSTSLLIGAIFLTPEDTFPDFIFSGYAGIFMNTPSSSQGLTSGHSAFRNEDTSSVPISPTVIHSQRQDSSGQLRVGPRSYSSLRKPFVRISSSYRYSPVHSGTPQGHQFSFVRTQPSFVLPAASMTSQGSASSSSYRSSNLSPSDLNTTAFDYSSNSPAYSAQSKSSEEQHSSQPSGDSSRLRYSERISPEEDAPLDSPQLLEPDEQEKDTIAASIFNPFDLTTLNRSH
ncbi:hypothetical protein J3R30DRAFT_2749502 [Lentinula aciculospora]|uniref:Uncharacterized protein n=1 Tax=Lentinula aciculospora TaxID=153920 RepID=A0A9W9AD44_9AGAR|nr:hypothetical protein J3R30DRAFT_2749502 [Lentinula aciculospora]